MTDVDLERTFLDLTTAHVADGLLRLGLPVRCAPAAVTPLWEDSRLVGRALPARHYGSVDVFLEALETARTGDVLVVDNGGRDDEACVGDLVALEARDAGLAGIVIWGLHRDTAELHTIRLPVFSLGALPAGPQRLDAQEADALVSARVGDHLVTSDDVVLADADGVLFLPLARAEEVAQAARGIRETEHRQAAAMSSGTSLRSQLGFAEFLAQRAATGTTFRQFLKTRGGAVEE